MKKFLRVLFSLFTALAAVVGSSSASSYTIDTTSSPSILTGLWWNANESGWGLTITQQYGVIFVAIYTYDAASNPIWYVITNCPVVAGGCTGDIYRATGGSALTSSWNPNLALVKVGAGTLAFADANTATMNFVINGISGSKAITRQVFATAPVQTGGAFPFTFMGIRLDSLTFATGHQGLTCDPTLSMTNVGATAVGGLLVFNVIIGGVTRGTTEFILLPGELAPGGRAALTTTVLIGPGTLPACNTFTLQFNPAASSIF